MAGLRLGGCQGSHRAEILTVGEGGGHTWPARAVGSGLAQVSSLSPQVLMSVYTWGHGDGQTQSPTGVPDQWKSPDTHKDSMPPRGICVTNEGSRKYRDLFPRTRDSGSIRTSSWRGIGEGK